MTTKMTGTNTVNSSNILTSRPPLLLVVSGPSGVGKDTILLSLRARGLDFHWAVTATTRPPRPGEAHGREYYFYSVSEFEELLKNNELLEHATVYGNYYGIPKSSLREALADGKDTIVRIDVQGATKVKQIVPEAVFIFIQPGSGEDLIRRLADRNTETPESLQRRLAKYQEEMQTKPLFDYVITNREGHLPEAVDELINIIQTEKERVPPRQIIL